MKTIKMLVYFCLSVFTAGAIWTGAAQAAETAGVVTAFKGKVEAIDPAGQSRELGKQDAVNVGETVRTGAGGYVVIEFVDGARATVRPNSELQIDRYAY
ncbi:MAG TPA: hypothetical protein VK973_02795, partial [Arenicellales bacterium]|nr:hypothetical protein [Arenicellales bacterium]